MRSIKTLFVLALVFGPFATLAQERPTAEEAKYLPRSNACEGAESQQYIAKQTGASLPKHVKDTLKKCEAVERKFPVRLTGFERSFISKPK